MIRKTSSLPPEIPLTELDIPDELMPEADGKPMESPWHRHQMSLLIETLTWHYRDREDFYVGGNIFIYYSLQQVLNKDFLGPDFFYVAEVDRRRERDRWIVWREGGRYPDVIIELLSPTTAEYDRTTKKAIYEKTFRTAEYFCHDPYEGELEGWRLHEGTYRDIEPDDRGWLWSEKLQLWLADWVGSFQDYETTWLRWHDREGKLVPTFFEAERQHADRERQRA